MSAELFHRKMDEGQHQAWLITARGKSGPVRCVIKTDETLVNPPAEHLREWLAAGIARLFGIRTPRPLVVEIDDAFGALLSVSSQVVFGSTYVTGLVPPSSGSLDEWILQAWDLFLFDLFIKNPDRRPEKPNFGLDDEGFVAFDHEYAFSFVGIIGDSTELAASGHYFAKQLRGTNPGLALDRFRARLNGLTESLIDQLRASVPPEWAKPPSDLDVDAILEHLLCRRDDAAWLEETERWVKATTKNGRPVTES